MTDAPIRVLLIEDSSGDARLIREMVRDAPEARIELRWARSLAEALTFLAEGGIDLILLDLMLPDSRGFPTLRTVRNRAGSLPVIVLTGLEDEEMAVSAVGEGAQDYLVKDQIDPMQLARAIRHARQRHRLHRASGSDASPATAVDGILVRGAFLTAASRRFALAREAGFALRLILVNVDGLKAINDRHGRAGGDAALAEVARRLVDACGDADLVGHIGGGEFAVLCAEVGQRPPADIGGLLNASLSASDQERGHSLHASIGAACHDPRAPSTCGSFDELLARAGTALKPASGRAAAG